MNIQFYFNKNKHILLISLYTLFQLICLFIFDYTPYPDSNGYISLAKECVEYNTFYPRNLKDIYFLWNIGAINAVVISLKLFNSILPLLISYSIIQGLEAYLIFKIAQKLFNHKIAFITLCLFILYPANYGTGTSVLSETPFIFFSLLGVHQSLKHNYITSGICFAIANYFRPMVIIYIAAILIYFIIKKLKLLNYFKLAVGFYIITICIGLINVQYKGKYFTQGAMGWMGLMQYSWDHDSNNKEDFILFEDKDPNNINNKFYDCLQRDSVWRSHFIKWLSQNKMEYIKQMPEKLIRTYISDNVNLCTFINDKNNRTYIYEEINMTAIINKFPYYNKVQTLVFINLIFYYFLLFSGLSGFFLSIKHKQYIKIVIPSTTIIIGTAILLIAGHGEARFHQPFIPMFIILSAYFLSTLTFKKQHKLS